MKTSIASMFGLTQREMAMALGIGVSQWSMYEIGQRKLPERAQRLLNEMLEYRSSARVKKNSAQHELAAKRADYLKKLLEENALKQSSLLREIDSIRKKHVLAEQYPLFDDFVNKKNANKQHANKDNADFAPMFIETHKKKRQYMVIADDLLFQHELRLELLIRERDFLESASASLRSKAAHR